MKFDKILETHLSTEWRQQYMNYVLLKDLIKHGVENLPPANLQNRYQFLAYYKNFEEGFFIKYENELNKVNNFYLEKLAEARRKLAMLKFEVANALNINKISTLPYNDFNTLASQHTLLPICEDIHNVKPADLRKLSSAFVVYYFNLILLYNYQTLNYTGFHKICRKFDKNFYTEKGINWIYGKVDYAAFADKHELSDMIVEVENIYTNYLAGGNRARAMAKLHVPPLGEPTKPILVFRAGLSLGMFIVLAMITFVCYWNLMPNSINAEAFSYLYRGPLAWVLFNFLMAFNVAGWQRAGVNYVLIFEMDPRDHLQAANYLEIASLFGILWLTSILGSIYHNFLNISQFLCPIILVITIFTAVLNPLPIMQYTSRRWLIRLMGRIITAPFHHVRFADFWLGEQLNSLDIYICDYYYIMRFYATCLLKDTTEISTCFKEDYIVPMARGLPAWLRFVQCLRRYRDSGCVKPISHLINAGKYASSLPVIYFCTMKTLAAEKYLNTFENPYVWGFLISSVISTAYYLAWDLLRDFGLFKNWLGSKIFLREQLIYPAIFYYFAIIENTLLRFLWAFEFYVNYTKLMSPYVTKTIVSILEIFRRFIWNYLRLEHEHLTNCGNFRATRDIFLTTLIAQDQLVLEAMMDAPEGVVNRNMPRENAKNNPNVLWINNILK